MTWTPCSWGHMTCSPNPFGFLRTDWTPTTEIVRRHCIPPWYNASTRRNTPVLLEVRIVKAHVLWRFCNLQSPVIITRCCTQLHLLGLSALSITVRTAQYKGISIFHAPKMKPSKLFYLSKSLKSPYVTWRQQLHVICPLY